jgi:aminoglycoside phosphotransferase family enzyme
LIDDGTHLNQQNRRATQTPPNTGCEEEFEDNQRGNQNLYIEEEQITNGQKKKYKGQTTNVGSVS